MNYTEENRITLESVHTQEVSRTFISKVFLWMAGALILTAITSFLIAANFETVLPFFVNPTGQMSILFWITIFAPFALVLVMSAAVNKLSLSILSVLYVVYAILMGVSLSFIFLAYDLGTIGVTFAVTAGTFIVMAVMGYTTKTDLTKFGSLLMMALFGIIIAMVVNLFMRSGTMDYIISILGVLIFTGLTAYDVQKLRRYSAQIGEFNNTAGKMALMGAVTLYLDFINLFLFLLRIFGRRN
ncbi:MAG: Bax inhibitor-1/YccA family protein [Bacteroidales bacterium]|nr:Bax inhibitor-1/YccA family protein [Bacteroidales bacterium]